MASHFDLPVVVNTDDLTLDELDRASKLTSDGVTGNVAALAYVWLKRSHPAVKLDDVKMIRQRDVDITNDAELADQLDDDERQAAELGPTS